MLWAAVIKAQFERDHLQEHDFAEAVAVLSLVAPRPGELFKEGTRPDAENIMQIQKKYSDIKVGQGILVEYIGSLLVFTIAGIKTGKMQGQEWRRIWVKVENDQSNFLLTRIVANHGQPILIGFECFTRLTPWIRQLSKECFKTLKTSEHVTVYTFRHLIGSEMKGSGFDGKQIALVLGQQSDETQEVYGRARMAKGGTSIIHVEAASSVRNKKNTSLCELRQKKRHSK